MATINTLNQLTVPTDADNLVIENAEGNFKTPYRQIEVINYADGIPNGYTAKQAIDLLLTYFKERKGGSDAWGMGLVCAQWAGVSNGIQMLVMVGRWGDYKAYYGMAITQANGIHVFTRFDTGASEGTLRTGQISDVTLS